MKTEQITALIADLRVRINPAYATQLGTESYERRLCAEAIEALVQERDALQAELNAIKAQEPVAWMWEVAEDSPIQKRKGNKQGVYFSNPEIHGISMESTSYKWTPLITRSKS